MPPPPGKQDPRPGKSPDTRTANARHKEQTPVTSYKLNHFTIADAAPLAGKAADITEYDDDELETRVTYPGARVIGIIDRTGPCLVIQTAGAVITDTRTGEQLGTRPPEPELRVLLAWVCEVARVRDPYRPGDRIALEETSDPHTRLRPGDEGTVTRYDPKSGQLDVRWDSGSTLSMLLNDGDRVRPIAPARGARDRGSREGAGPVRAFFPAATVEPLEAALLQGPEPRPSARPGSGRTARSPERPS
jgi:hypothetical protein